MKWKMTERFRLLALIVLITLIPACTSPATTPIISTSTTLPSPTKEPILTDTPTATATKTATATPEPPDLAKFSDIYMVCPASSAVKLEAGLTFGVLSDFAHDCYGMVSPDVSKEEGLLSHLKIIYKAFDGTTMPNRDAVIDQEVEIYINPSHEDLDLLGITPTPGPQFITIGSPFPPEWGTPQIWSNDSFNGPLNFNAFDMHHGHVDIAVPKGSPFDGYYLDKHSGDVRSPVAGTVYTYQYGIKLVLPNKTYPVGILEALNFAGIPNPSLNKISEIEFDIGHVKNPKTGDVEKGEVIGEIEPLGFNYENRQYASGVAFQVIVYYGSKEYMFTPTLFGLDNQWECFPYSRFDCEPEPLDYP